LLIPFHCPDNLNISPLAAQDIGAIAAMAGVSNAIEFGRGRPAAHRSTGLHPDQASNPAKRASQIALI